jgi:hypothetical protein
MLARCFVFVARPSRDFWLAACKRQALRQAQGSPQWTALCPGSVPAGDLLSGPPESRQRAAPAKPPLRGALRCSEPGAAPNSLRYAPFKQRGANSVLEARCARAPDSCASRRFRRGEPKQPNSQQPNAHALRSWLFLQPPFEPAEERKALRPRAQRASSSDFAQLSERSVAKRVLREASRLEYRRAARCAAKGRAVRGRLFAYFLVAQKVGRPPGRRPGMGLANHKMPE